MDARPSVKTLSTTAGAAGFGTLIVWVAQQFGLEMSAEVGVAIATVIAFVISYFVPATEGKWVVTEPLSEELDPNDALTESEYVDPNPDEITDTDDVNHIEFEVK